MRSVDPARQPQPSSSPQVRRLAEQYIQVLLESGLDSNKAEFMACLDRINRELLGYKKEEDELKRDNYSDFDGERYDDDASDDKAEFSYSNRDAGQRSHAFTSLLSSELKHVSHESLSKIKEARLGIKKHEGSHNHNSNSKDFSNNQSSHFNSHNSNKSYSSADLSDHIEPLQAPRPHITRCDTYPEGNDVSSHRRASDSVSGNDSDGGSEVEVFKPRTKGAYQRESTYTHSNSSQQDGHSLDSHSGPDKSAEGSL